MSKIQGDCQCKSITVLERETITANYCSQNRHIKQFSPSQNERRYLAGKVRHDCWFFCPGCIHYANMNQSLYLLFHYLRQVKTSLEDCYFVLEGHKKRLCFLSKCWLNNIFLRISKWDWRGCVLWSSLDPKQTEMVIRFFI